ncbi:MAG: imidazoleglycerol-phosphate dehydratase [Vampirovibrionales bacterium]|nr:imidazoleglycerol-phosphate dehydratase [Vampirovibrionales bacterium]
MIDDKKTDDKKSPRKSTVSRQTKETQIALSLDLDGKTASSIQTGLPFFDHMLTAFACHGRFSLNVDAVGDIDVDPHHLIEDTGIVLGEAIAKALPGYSGIERAGSFAFPMDGTLPIVALDLCGRANLVWKVEFGPFLVGGIDPNLFREFYKGLVDGMKGTLHVHTLVQDNDHHLIESIFKGFARSLRQAVTPLSQDAIVLSTKGMIDV